MRAFGFIPDVSQWELGDLVLLSTAAPDLIQAAILKTQQRLGFAPSHAAWYHAAVYIGDYMVCEATRSGVQASSIFAYFLALERRPLRIRIRRDYGLSGAQAARLVIQALIRLKYDYSLLSNGFLWWHAATQGFTGAGAPRRIPLRATICSQLYADAYGIVTGKTLSPSTDRNATPADLSASGLLRDVPGLRWIRL